MGLPVFGGEGDGGAAHGVVEPGVFSGGEGEEAFELAGLGDLGEEGAGSVEEGEEAVPVDGEEEGGVGGEEGSAGGEGGVAGGELVEREGDDGVGEGKLWDVEELGVAGGGEGVEEVGLEEGLEAAFGGHPDGMGLEAGLEELLGVGVGEVGCERADGGEQSEVDAGAGGEASEGGDLSPGAGDGVGGEVDVRRVGAGGGPGELRGYAEEGVEEDEDGFKLRGVGLDERDFVGGIGVLGGLHATG